jgi:hypothetical protein
MEAGHSGELLVTPAPTQRHQKTDAELMYQDASGRASGGAGLAADQVPEGMCLEVPVALVMDEGVLWVEAMLLQGEERALKHRSEEWQGRRAVVGSAAFPFGWGWLWSSRRLHVVSLLLPVHLLAFIPLSSCGLHRFASHFPAGCLSTSLVFTWRRKGESGGLTGRREGDGRKPGEGRSKTGGGR